MRSLGYVVAVAGALVIGACEGRSSALDTGGSSSGSDESSSQSDESSSGSEGSTSSSEGSTSTSESSTSTSEGSTSEGSTSTSDDTFPSTSDDTSTSSTPAVCGDGILDADEECDDGNDVDTDACTSSCVAPTCGDGLVYAGVEECDDGPATGDGASTCAPGCLINACGDAYLHASEACDEGEATGDGVSECGPACQTNTCGDGYPVLAIEACDPGAPSITCEDDCTSVVVPAIAVDTGDSVSCVAFEPGVVRCWGRHWPVQYSIWSTRAADVPDIDLGALIVQLSTSYRHACALLPGGSVRCWGDGNDGRLGYASTDAIGDDETPATAGDVDVGGPVVHVAAGAAHTCALLEGGAVRCWGRAERGSLGLASAENIGDDEIPASAATVDVGGTVVQLDANMHTCALLEGGAVRCWGANDHGQLGYGHTEDIGDDESPASEGDIDVGGVVVQVAVGWEHTCVLLEGGSVRCWGAGGDGRLGYANTETIGDDETPATAGDVDVGGTVVRVAAGFHTCAILDTGGLRCWGTATHTSQLGYGDYVDCPWGFCDYLPVGDDETPASVGDVPIEGGSDVEQVAPGIQHTCAILRGGSVRCWGNPGQFGIGYGDEYVRAFADEDVPL